MKWYDEEKWDYVTDPTVSYLTNLKRFYKIYPPDIALSLYFPMMLITYLFFV